MKLISQSLTDSHRIDDDYVFAVWVGGEQKVKLSKNLNPHLAWSDFPSETQSFAILCVDPDVPSCGDDVNQEGKTVSKDLPRVDFFHWALVDVRAHINEVRAGEFSNGVTARGKSGPEAVQGMRQGINNYTQWFAGDENMKGNYFGYDGPCPPWNDEIIHRYHFRVYALSCERFPVEGEFSALEVYEKIRPLILDQSEITALYAINPEAQTLDNDK